MTSRLDTRTMPTDWAPLCRMVEEETGVVLDPSRAEFFESRLAPLARQHDLRGAGALAHAVLAGGAGHLYHKAIQSLLTLETSFFRDMAQLETLATTVLPALLRSRTAQQAVRCWSAGCATGQEAYSLAMLVRERWPASFDRRITILATDISRDAILAARTGWYPAHACSRGLSQERLEQYFVRHGSGWQADIDLRASITFEPHNLVHDPLPTGPFDVILLRNVLLYFSPATRRRILDAVHAVLAPDGRLFLGAAESLLEVHERFRTVVMGGVIYYAPDMAGPRREA